MTKRIPFLVLVLFCVGGAFSLYVNGTKAARMAQGLSGAMEDPALAAEAFRGPIQSVDSLLFSPAPVPSAARRELAARLERLGRSVERDGGTRLARYFAGEIRTLAHLARGGRPLEGGPLDHLRGNWCRIRSSLFSDAAWFRYDETDSLNTRDPEPRVLSAEDRFELDRIERVLGDATALADRAAREVETLGEPAVDANGLRENEGVIVDRWSAWTDEWRERLAELDRELPEKLDWGHRVEVRFALGETRDAIHALRRVPLARGPWRVPIRAEWEESFAKAAAKLEKARHWVGEARKDDPRR